MFEKFQHNKTLTCKKMTMTQKSTLLQYGNAKQVSFEQERQETK
jgi:hypothetical protein